VLCVCRCNVVGWCVLLLVCVCTFIVVVVFLCVVMLCLLHEKHCEAPWAWKGSGTGKGGTGGRPDDRYGGAYDMVQGGYNDHAGTHWETLACVYVVLAFLVLFVCVYMLFLSWCLFVFICLCMLVSVYTVVWLLCGWFVFMWLCLYLCVVGMC
jgi:hypothetical protein